MTYSCSVKLSTVGRAPTGGTGSPGVEATTLGAAGETSRGGSFFSGSLVGTGTETGGASGTELGGFSGFSTDGTAGVGVGVGVEGGVVRPTSPGEGGVTGLSIEVPEDGG